jgi:hypothetical protein
VCESLRGEFSSLRGEISLVVILTTSLSPLSKAYCRELELFVFGVPTQGRENVYFGFICIFYDAPGIPPTAFCRAFEFFE